MHGFFKCKDKKWDGGIQILWAKSVKWRQIRARWGGFRWANEGFVGETEWWI